MESQKALCTFFNQTSNSTDYASCYKECCSPALSQKEACCNDALSFWLGISVLFPMIGGCLIIPLLKIFGRRIEKCICGVINLKRHHSTPQKILKTNDDESQDNRAKTVENACETTTGNDDSNMIVSTRLIGDDEEEDPPASTSSIKHQITNQTVYEETG